jgi:hypothetical protein
MCHLQGAKMTRKGSKMMVETKSHLRLTASVVSMRVEMLYWGLKDKDQDKVERAYEELRRLTGKGRNWILYPGHCTPQELEEPQTWDGHIPPRTLHVCEECGDVDCRGANGYVCNRMEMQQ